MPSGCSNSPLASVAKSAAYAWDVHRGWNVHRGLVAEFGGQCRDSDPAWCCQLLRQGPRRVARQWPAAETLMQSAALHSRHVTQRLAQCRLAGLPANLASQRCICMHVLTRTHGRKRNIAHMMHPQLHKHTPHIATVTLQPGHQQSLHTVAASVCPVQQQCLLPCSNGVKESTSRTLTAVSQEYNTPTVPLAARQAQCNCAHSSTRSIPACQQVIKHASNRITVHHLQRMLHT